MNKNILAIIFNVLIIICSILGIYLTGLGLNMVYYYAEISNALAGIAAFLLVVSLLTKKEIAQVPFGVMVLKYIATTMLLLTFLVVVCVLIPQSQLSGSNLPWYFYLTEKGMFFTHVLNPIIAVISFCFFENDKRLNKKNNIIYPIIVTALYGGILIALNYLKQFNGPYFFFKVYEQEIYVTVIWVVALLIINYFLARLLLIQNQKRVPRRTSEIKKRIASK